MYILPTKSTLIENKCIGVMCFITISNTNEGVVFFPFLDKTCSKTQVFENDMKTCNRTCRSLSNYDYTCEVKDVPVFGCGCPEGTYMDKDGACVDKSSCHCYIGREIIKTGQDRTLNGKTW